MAEDKHTPGPWWVAGDPFHVEAKIDGKSQLVATFHLGVRWSEKESGFCDMRKERNANAVLSANAPRMLETLEFILSDPCFSKLGSVTQDEVNATIAAAKDQS